MNPGDKYKGMPLILNLYRFWNIKETEKKESKECCWKVCERPIIKKSVDFSKKHLDR